MLRTSRFLRTRHCSPPACRSTNAPRFPEFPFSTRPRSRFVAKVPLDNGAGDLALSQDGASLYTWSGYYLYALDTKSFKVSRIDMGDGYGIFGVVVAPSGNQAIFEGANGTYQFQLLDTTANTVSGDFPAPPLQMPLEPGSGGSVFSPDGTVLWSLTESLETGNCTLIGQSFPSGDVIAQTPIPTTVRAIAF